MKRVSLKIIVSIFTLIMLSGGIFGQSVVDINYKSDMTWSGIAGDPNFSLSDRLAIKDVMNAYAFYWDKGDLDNYLRLFTKERLRKVNKESTQKRLEFFKSHGMQRRHLMTNTHFLEQNDSTAFINQYALLTNTLNEQEFSTITTVVYDVWLVKVDGIWKISSLKINLDGELDI